MKKAVCLISGGLDSTVSAYIAKNDKYKIHSLSFLYGQRHKKEIECAKNIGKKINSIDHIFFKLDLGLFGGSSLTDKDINLRTNKENSLIEKDIPSSYVPARNTIFLSIALAYAEVIDANAIFIGVNSVDYSGYPDCRPEFIKAYQKMVDVATKKTVHGNKIKIKTPLLYLTKSEIILKGKKLKVPFESTWSCYQGSRKACGKCDSCILRLKGFKKLDMFDPIDYEYYPDWYNKK